MEHPVHACVAHDGGVGDAECFEQVNRVLVLNKKMGKSAKHIAVFMAVPAEENLLGAEDAGYAIDGNVAAMESGKIVLPKFILDLQDCII